MIKLTTPRRRRLTKTEREILEKFRAPTVERRDPFPRTISNALTNGLLIRVGRVEGNFSILQLTDKGLERLQEDADTKK